jgi:hypothetical protein
MPSKTPIHEDAAVLNATSVLPAPPELTPRRVLRRRSARRACRCLQLLGRRNVSMSRRLRCPLTTVCAGRIPKVRPDLIRISGPAASDLADALWLIWILSIAGNGQSHARDLTFYEWYSSPDDGFQPVGLIDLSSTTVAQNTAYNAGFGNFDTSGTGTHNLVEYCNPKSGALVFGARRSTSARHQTE